MRDCGWIGEDSTGIWVRRHPQVALMAEPDLWPIVWEWQAGLRDFTAEAYATKSSFEYEGKLVMASAHAREESRRIKRPREEDE